MKQDYLNEQAERIFERYIRAATTQVTFFTRMRMVSKAAHTILRNWKHFKFRFVMRESLLRQQVFHQMQHWQKMLLPPHGKAIT